MVPEVILLQGISGRFYTFDMHHLDPQSFYDDRAVYLFVRESKEVDRLIFLPMFIGRTLGLRNTLSELKKDSRILQAKPDYLCIRYEPCVSKCSSIVQDVMGVYLDNGCFEIK